MNDNSFALAMGKIVGQHEAEVQQEIQDQKRRVKIGRVRKVFVFLFIATLFVFGFCYREKLETVVTTKLFHSNPASQAAGTTGQASSALNGARQNAATRDKLIDDLSK